ncbi:MAG: hypothetical protein ACRDDW_06150 [Candidatus Rhabdochlamydia sp.]
MNSTNVIEKPKALEIKGGSKLMDEICQGTKLKFNIESAEKTLAGNSKIYPSDLLLKELKSTYERALNISTSGSLKEWEDRFTDKIKNFEKNFSITEQTLTTENPEMEAIYKKAKTLGTLLENMKWIKSLLHILSDRKDLSKSVQKYCSEKQKSMDKHIEAFEKSSKKKLGTIEKKESSNAEVERNNLNALEILLHNSINFSQEDELPSSSQKSMDSELLKRRMAVADSEDENSSTEEDNDWAIEQ